MFYSFELQYIFVGKRCKKMLPSTFLFFSNTIQKTQISAGKTGLDKNVFINRLLQKRYTINKQRTTVLTYLYDDLLHCYLIFYPRSLSEQRNDYSLLLIYEFYYYNLSRTWCWSRKCFSHVYSIGELLIMLVSCKRVVDHQFFSIFLCFLCEKVLWFIKLFLDRRNRA